MDRKLRVLVIDDDEEVQRTIRDTLPKEEFELKGELEIYAGLREVLRFNPDLLILDYILPEQSGMDALKELKSHHLTKDLPVLVLSSAGNPGVIESFYQLGAMDFISKPIVPRILREKIRSLAENMHLKERPRRHATGEIIGFLGVKGGVGTSTVAANTALLLAQEIASDGKKVLLVDTSSFYSSLKSMFEIKDGRSMFTLIQEHPFDLDKDYLFQRLTQVTDNFYLLPSVEKMGQFETVREEDFSVVMYILANHFDYIFIDMDRSFSDANLFILENADSIMLVTNTTRPSLQNLHDTVETFMRIGIDRGKLGLVLNGFERGEKIKGEELLRFVGVASLVTFKSLPEKYRPAEESRIPAAAVPRSPVTAEYRSFVETILEISANRNDRKTEQPVESRV